MSVLSVTLSTPMYLVEGIPSTPESGQVHLRLQVSLIGPLYVFSSLFHICSIFLFCRVIPHVLRQFSCSFTFYLPFIPRSAVWRRPHYRWAFSPVQNPHLNCEMSPKLDEQACMSNELCLCLLMIASDNLNKWMRFFFKYHLYLPHKKPAEIANKEK